MEPVYSLANGLGRTLMRVLGYDIAITGSEHIPATGPVILASTHVSYVDFLLVELAAVRRGRYVRFLTRHDVWNLPVVRRAMDAMGHVPVDREAPAHAYLRARSALRAGEAVGIYPEAGISLAFTVRPLMRGAVSLALETGAPLVPMAVWGPQRTFSPGLRQVRRGQPVDVVVGSPLTLPSGTGPADGTRLLGSALQVLLDGLQRQERHQPPPGESPRWHPAHLGGRALGLEEALSLNPVPRSAVPPGWTPGAA